MHKIYEENLNKVLKAVGNPIRRKIILNLYNAKENSFTDLMLELEMNPKIDSGKFTHHLKLLIDAGIIKEKEKKGRYELTELGIGIALLLKNLEENVMRENKKILVRTSNLTMEPFEKRKIVEAIIREAEAPRSIAEEIAEEAEERILRSNIKYLTAPLIREIVNSILLERGLEDYRHAMTRLGLPVYDVRKTISEINQTLMPPLTLYLRSGSAVISEYMLIRGLPREISDAHISGLININSLPYFGIIPESIHYDSSWVIESELNFENLESFIPTIKKSKSLDEALEKIVKIIHIMRNYISVGQVIDDINVMLATFIGNMKYDEILKKIKCAIVHLNQILDFMGNPQPFAIGLRLDKSLKEELFEEKLLLFRAFVEVFIDGDDAKRPFLTPLPIIKLDSHSLNDSNVQNEISRVCELILKWCVPVIVNIDWENNNIASYCWDLTRLERNISLVSNSCVAGTILINLPRIALEAKGDDGRFFSKINESIDISIKALEEGRNRIMERTSKGILPFLSTKNSIEKYSPTDVLLGNIGLVGLYEALKIHTGKYIQESKNVMNLSKKIVDEITAIIKEKGYIRLTEVSIEDAGRRFLISDGIRYGFKVIEEKIDRKVSGYTFNTIIPYEENVPLNKRIEVESIFHKKFLGGHYFKINIKEPILSINDLYEYLKRLMNEKKLAIFTFTRDYTYCRKCKSFIYGKREKCNFCGSSLSSLVYYSKKLNVYRREENLKIIEEYSLL
ncbi:MAG: anaerobic ribonucleoside-triphosphate reductase [Candidatus Methanomethylicia archaeon]